MALINCPECGKEVSDQAKTCAHCGYPISSSQKKKDGKSKPLVLKWLMLVVTTVAVLGVVVYILLTNNPEYILKKYLKYYTSGNVKGIEKLFYNGYDGNDIDDIKTGITIISYDKSEIKEVSSEQAKMWSENTPEEKGIFKCYILYGVNYKTEYGSERRGTVRVGKFGTKWKILTGLD